jgi:hypothetical protein
MSVTGLVPVKNSATSSKTRSRWLNINMSLPGSHTGECEVRGNDLGGLAVHIAARIGSLASPNEVLVSSTVEDLVVGSGIKFQDAANTT